MIWEVLIWCVSIAVAVAVGFSVFCLLFPGIEKITGRDALRKQAVSHMAESLEALHRRNELTVVQLETLARLADAVEEIGRRI